MASFLVAAVIAPLDAQTESKSASMTRKPGVAIEGLKNPTKLILYSLDGKKGFRRKDIGPLVDAKDTYGDCPILGKVEITDQKDRDELVAALQDAIVNHDNISANCFWPGHAIYAVENEKTFEKTRVWNIIKTNRNRFYSRIRIRYTNNIFKI